MNDRDQLDEIIRNATHVDALKDPENLEELQRADLIFGVDISTGEHDLFFGKHALKRVMDSNEQEDLAIFAFKYDSGTSDLEFFCEKVKEVKGSCDFRGGNNRPSSSAAKIRVYDPESKTTQEIPASELAPGYALAVVPGVHGVVYVNTGERIHKSVPRHKDLSEECKRVIGYYIEKTQQVDVRTVDQHFAGFCAERDPVRELLIHFHIAYVYAKFAKHKIVSPDDRRSLFAVIVRCSLAEQHTAMETLDFETLSLSRGRVQQIVDYYFTCDWMAEFQLRFDVNKMSVIGP